MQVRSTRTRQKIVIATAQAINDRSYDRASLASIADDAGVTTGAFYFHFRRKEDAALAVMRIQDEYSQDQALDLAGAWNGPTFELILETSSGLMRDIVQDPIVRAGVRLAAEIGLLDTFPTEIWQKWIGSNVQQLTMSRDEGSLRPDIDIAGTAELLVSSIAGTFLLCSLERDMRRLLPRINHMWQQFIRANAVDPGRWLPVAERIFDVRALEPLALAKIQHRHSAAIASQPTKAREPSSLVL